MIPIGLDEANDFVEQFHRHNGRTNRDGGKFAIGASTEVGMVGVAIVGSPLARMLQDGWTAEVTRLCVLDGAPKGTCSFLYARCWRAWSAQGGAKLVTYTLADESGASLRGAGWRVVAQCKPRSAGAWNSRDRARDWKPIYGQQKLRWEFSG